MILRATCTTAAVATALALAAHAADWPQFRGPDRSAISKETGLLRKWPEGGPRLVWKAANLGEGHSTPSVAGGRVFGMGLRGENEVVWALDEKTGKELWSTRIAGAIVLGGPQGGYGPRSTPTVDGSRLFALGVGGELVCLETQTGRLEWSKSLVKDFGGSVPTWGYSESPLVDGDKVIATPGGANTIVAFNKATGAVIWTAKIQEGSRVAYSSCIPAVVGGRRQYVQFLAGGVVGVDARTGELLWRYDRPANRQGINCSMPLVQDDLVFAASAYGNGGGLAKVSPQGAGFQAQEVYFTRQMQNHHGGMVLLGGHLYGFDNSSLTCLEWKTGTVKWTDRSVGKGSLVAADGLLIARSERGSVALIEANPEKYVELGRFDQPDRSSAPSWPYPVVANGRLYLRDQDILLCYDATAGSAAGEGRGSSARAATQ